MALGPRPEDVSREYIEGIFDLATGERKGRSNTPDYTAGLGCMAPGGDPTPRDEWITTYEANWDPRNFYEADLDGIPLPEDRYLHLDAHLYQLPEGYKAPTSNTNGRTWMESVIGAIAGQKGDVFVNPTGIAAKGTAIYNLYNKYDDAGRCANLVTVSSLPGRSSPSDSLWSDPSWLDEPSHETPWLVPERYASVATRTQLQVPIESVPIGSRVPTKNPEPLRG